MALKKTGLVVVGILVLLALYFIVVRNNFVGKEEVVKSTWNNLQSDYQRRNDLIPSLVSTVKGSANFEAETLQQVAEARSKATNALKNAGSSESVKELDAANGLLIGATNRLLGTIEKYPELKTTTSFLRLQDQLEGTERRIKFSRNDFNDAVKRYNTSVRSFPSSIVASIFGFKPKDGFMADASAENAPTINFIKK